jgi:Kef-type K+ transport system membrane component KefB
MENIIGIIIIVLVFVAFLYFGYKDDFNRNPGAFIYTILAVIFIFVTFGLANRSSTIAGFLMTGVAMGFTLKWKEKVIEKINDYLRNEA